MGLRRTHDAKYYANIYRQYANYMRAFGGTSPFLIACGPNQNDAAWTRGFFNGMGGGCGPTGYAKHYYQDGTATRQRHRDAMNQVVQRTENYVEGPSSPAHAIGSSILPAGGGPRWSRRRDRRERRMDKAWRCSWMNGACGIN